MGGGSFRPLAGTEGERVERGKRSEERLGRRLVKGLRATGVVGEIGEVLRVRERNAYRGWNRGGRGEERGRVRERSARAKGDGGAIPVRLSAVRTSAVLLQSRICAFTRARISACRAVTDQHREPIQDVNLVTRVGLEWKRRSAAPKGADGCSGLGEPYHCTRNGNDVLIDLPLFCWPGRLPDGARLATSARTSGRAYAIFRDQRHGRIR